MSALQRQVLSSEFRHAALVGLTLQAPLSLVSLLTLDGGGLARICGLALLGFWIVAGAIAVRRPWQPTRGDLAFWKWGLAVCFVFVFSLAALAGGLGPIAG